MSRKKIESGELSLNRKKKKKKSKNKFISVFFGTIWSVFKFAIPLGFLLATATVIFIFAGTPQLQTDDLIRMDLTSSVCYRDSDGKIVELEKIASTQSRYWVALNKVPQHMRDAFVSIEDERFYEHSGFDIKRTTKAIIEYFQIGSDAVGGSTLTQQLVKNVTGNAQISPIRKIQEIWLAYNLERQLSKDQILELYVNTIYLSQGVNGVQTAANLYFDKDVSELSLAESASISGITQSPTYYDPFLNPENNKVKQEIVLGKMLELGKISKAEHDAASAEALNFKKGNMRVALNTQSYFVDQVITDVIEDLVNEKGMTEVIARKKVYNGGYRIIATMDPFIQKSIDDVFGSAANFPKSPSTVPPQGAIVVMEPKTGYIRGMSGGIGQKSGAFSLNRAIQTVRQPGSTIKPIAVYAPALESGLITPNKVYTDKKVTFGNWSPNNYDRTFRGDMTIRAAVQISNNTIPVQIVAEMGAAKSINFLKDKLKITSLVKDDENYGALALGGLTNGISVLELTAAYATFPNRGVYTKPTTYYEVLDNSGRKVLTSKRITSIAMSEKTAGSMVEMLRGVVSGGTGTAANIASNVAGKTGTTDADKDRWFVGFTPEYIAAVWYGYDQPKSMGYISGNPALNAWKKVMQPVLSANKNKAEPLPTNAKSDVTVSICSESGSLASSGCKTSGTDLYKTYTSGSQPTGYCTVHKGGAVATAGPDENTEEPEESPEPSGEPLRSPGPAVPTAQPIATPTPMKPTPTPPPPRPNDQNVVPEE